MNKNNWINNESQNNIEDAKNNIKEIFQEYAWEINYIKNKHKLLFDYKDWTNFNITIFWDDVREIQQEDIDIYNNKLEESLIKLKKLKSKINSNDQLTSSIKKYLLNTINNYWLQFILMKKSVYIEAEKAGYKIDQNMKKTYVNQINKLQDIVYWPQIKESESETESILQYLHKKYEENENKLNEDQKDEILGLFEKYNLNPNSQEESNNIKNHLLSDKISQSDFVPIFEKIMKIVWIDGWKVKISADKKFFTVSWKDLLVPESITEESILRILELIDHELMTHMVRWVNNSLVFKELTTSWNTKSEEWMAIMSEKLITQNLESIKVEPTIHHITIFLWEVSNDSKQLKKLMEAYFILIWNKTQEEAVLLSEDRIKRVKRFYPLDMPWANRKDTSYTRGLIDIVETLQKMNDEEKQSHMKDFYFWKLSKEYLPLVPELKQSLDISEEELTYPLWLWKILFEKLNYNYDNFKDSEIPNKWALKWFEKKDFRFNWEQFNSKNITYSKAKELVEILQNMRKIKDKQDWNQDNSTK